MTTLATPPEDPGLTDIADPAEAQQLHTPQTVEPPPARGFPEWSAALIVHWRATLKEAIDSGKIPRPVLLLLLPIFPLIILVLSFGLTTTHEFLLRYSGLLLGALVLAVLLAGFLLWVVKRLRRQMPIHFADLTFFHYLIYLFVLPAIVLAAFAVLPISAMPDAVSRVVLIYPDAERHHHYPPGVYSSIEAVVKELAYKFPNIKSLRYSSDDDLEASFTQEFYANTFSVLITTAGLSPERIWEKLPAAERRRIIIIGTDPFNGSAEKPGNWLYCSQGVDQEIEELKPIFQAETADNRIAILRDSTEASGYAAKAIRDLLEPLPVPHHWTKTIAAADASVLLGDLVTGPYAHHESEYLVITASHPWVEGYLTFLRQQQYRGTVVLLSPASLFLTVANRPDRLILTGPRQLYSSGSLSGWPGGVPPLDIDNVLTASLRSAVSIAEQLRTKAQRSGGEVQPPVPEYSHAGSERPDLGQVAFTPQWKASVAAQAFAITRVTEK